MGTSQTEFRSQTVDLSAEAFDTFCNDISGMFGVDMTCKQQEVAAESFQGIKKRFKGMVAVNCIKSEGALDGTFQLVFDRDGLFILAGIILTLPEQKILENIKSGSPEEANGLRDAITEAGNLLAGSWDRAFRKGLEGHGQLAQAGVFVGDPWLKPEEKIGLAGDEKIEFVAYRMTVGPYPAFNCGVVFPKTIFGDLLEAEAEAEEKASAEAEEEARAEAEEKAKPEAEEEVTVEAEEKAEAEAEEKVKAEVEEKADTEAEEEPEAKAEEKTESEAEEETGEKAQEPEAAVEETDSEESDKAQESDGEKSEPQEPVTDKAAPAETAAKEDTEEVSITGDEAASAGEPEPAEEAKPVEKEPAVEKVGEEEGAAKEEPEVTGEEKATDADASASADVTEEKAAVPSESEEGPVSESIRKMGESPADLPGEPAPPAVGETPVVSSTGVASAMCAKDIMQKDVVWGEPDDSVHQALTKMQQYDAGYMMVGRDGVLEGIVSKSDIAGAISPYLRPIFAKWRRPLDDATLQIKVKWIMIRPVHTIRPETSLAAIMENMCQSGRRVLPVMDQQGKIRGLVTVFDVFKALLNGDPNVSTAGKTPEAPPLA